MPITKTGKSKDGQQQYRVRVNYTDANGVHRQIERKVYGSSAAKETERRLANEYQNGAVVHHRMTLRELAEEYAGNQRHEVRETSLDKAVNTIKVGVLPIIGDMYVDRLGTDAMQKWKNQIGDRDLSLTTKKNYYKYLNALLNYAVNRDYIASNPLRKVGNFKDTMNIEKAEEIRYYTAEQYLRFAAVAREEAELKNNMQEWAFYVFFSLAFYTGMRKGEINALRWSDFDGKTIRVRYSIAQKLRGGDRETGPKNTPSVRDLQAPQPLIDILDEHKARLMANGRYSASSYVCGGDKALRDTTIDHKNRKYASLADLPHITIHEFRHTHASVLVNEGINIQEIARRLGHSDVQETWRTYAHLYPREEERAVSVLDKIR